MAVLLGFMTTTGVAGWLNIRGIDCSITFGDEVYSGSPTLVTVHLHNRKGRMPSYLLQVRLFGDACKVVSVEGKGTATASLTHTFQGRGEHPCRAVVIRSPFPVNFFVRAMELPVTGGVVVFPAPCPLSLDAFQTPSEKSGELLRDNRGHDGDLATISDYTGAEPLKLIHWRLSARHEWFKVKEPGATTDEPIMLDLTLPSRLSLEERLSQATFLVNRLCRANRPVGLRLDQKRSIPAATGRSHRLRLLGELAIHDPARQTT